MSLFLKKISTKCVENFPLDIYQFDPLDNAKTLELWVRFDDS